MSRPTARDISELRSKVIEIANEGYFKYCASSLDGTTEITEDNLQAAWDIIRDEDHSGFDSLIVIRTLINVLSPTSATLQASYRSQKRGSQCVRVNRWHF